jgi:hypothetical protein
VDRIVAALAAVAVGAALMWGWDRHPPIVWRGPIPIIGPTIRLPDSLQFERDEALKAAANAKAERAKCETQVAALGETLKQTTADTEAAKRESDRRLAAAHKAIEDRARVAESYRMTAEALAAYEPQGDDLCQRMLDADAAVMRALR